MNLNPDFGRVSRLLLIVDGTLDNSGYSHILSYRIL